MDKELQETIARVRRLSLRPDFRERAGEYMGHRYVFGNNEPVFGSKLPVYDSTERAIRYLQEHEPELFEKFRTAVEVADDVETGKQIPYAKIVAAIVFAKEIILQINNLQGGPIPPETAAIISITVASVQFLLESKTS